nr:hypothetical protein [Listeria ivanovii]
MKIFGELKARGVDDAFFLLMESVSDLEEGAKAIFPTVLVQLVSSPSFGIPSVTFHPKIIKPLWHLLRNCMSTFT